MDCDVIVIGSGPGGYVAAIKAAQHGKNVIIVEKAELGGICLNWGCIPTKALLKSAQLFDELQHAADFGIQTQSVGCDYAKVIQRSRQVAGVNSKGVQFLMKKNQIRVLYGEARIISRGLVQVNSNGEMQTLRCEHIIIATGARPREIPAYPTDGKRVISYRQALAMQEKPESILIIGSGAIGTEFSYFFSAVGTRVHLVEMQPQILPLEDHEIAKILEQSFRKRGIEIYTSASVQNLDLSKSRIHATINRQDGTTHTLEIDRVLVAAGMIPNSDHLGLEQAGIATDARGFITVDQHMQTSLAGVYAIGDVCGRQMLAHKASAEAEVAVAHICGYAHPVLDYGQIPSCIYCSPQVASIGLTEKACIERGMEIEIGRFPFQASGKARAIGHTEGLVKLIFAKPYGQLVGAHLIGADVTELLAELGLAMKLECTWEEIASTVHAHPTLSESIMEASLASQGKSTHI